MAAIENLKCRKEKHMKPLIDGKSIDQETAEAATCEECGAKMRYQARYVRQDDDEWLYSAWAICTNDECEYEFEF